MSQHPQQILHYAPLATEDDVAKHNGKHGARRVSDSWSRRSGSLTHVQDVGDECTGLITPNGMEVPLATVNQKRRKWWKDAIINLCFIASWYVEDVCWLKNSPIRYWSCASSGLDGLRYFDE